MALQETSQTDIVTNEEVLKRIFKKNRSMKKNREQDESSKNGTH